MQDGYAVPRVLLTAGEFDPRVDAWHARRCVPGSRPRPATSRSCCGWSPAGHGMGQSLDQLVALETDCFTFLFDRLGLDYDPARAGG